MATPDEASATLAEILDYPGPGYRQRLEAGIAQLAPSHPKAADALRTFLASVRDMRLPELQELYTATFDFRAEASLHGGWHLFGDDRRRGVFLVGLAERYRARGFSAGKELPDHVPVMLRFVSTPDGENEAIVADALLPALTAIARELDKLGNPYRHAVSSAIALLAASPAEGDLAAPAVAHGPVAAREEGRP